MRQYDGERIQVCEKARQVVLTVMFTPLALRKTAH